MNVIGVSCPGFCSVPFEEILPKVSKEFRHWEIFSEADHAVQGLAPGFAGVAAHAGMTFSIHASIADTDGAALNLRMREAAVLEFMSEMEAARDMGVDTLTVHPGITSLSVPDTRDRSIAAAKETMRVLDRAGREFGVTVCIENMPKLPVMLGTSASELAEIISGTNLSVCFDIGHAHTAGLIDAMIDVFGDRIANVHIHDNMGEKDEHLAIGEGTVDFAHAIGRLRGYSGRYIIESRDLESAVRSRKALEGLLARVRTSRCQMDPASMGASTAPGPPRVGLLCGPRL